MRLMRACMTRGTAVAICVTGRSVRSVASRRRRAAASGSRTTARNSSCQARVPLRHLAAGPPRTGGYGRPSWPISRWPCPRRLGARELPGRCTGLTQRDQPRYSQPRAEPPFWRDIGSVPIVMPAIQIWIFCALTGAGAQGCRQPHRVQAAWPGVAWVRPPSFMELAPNP